MNLKNLGRLALCLVIGVTACNKQNPKQNQLTTKEKEMGYSLLFDGKDLDGWHSYLQDEPGSAWSVENGTITFDPESGSGGDLTSDEQYQDFALKLEWKISPGGNSGIIFGVHESPKFKQTYYTGPEMQVLDNASYEDRVKPSQLAGSLYDLIAAPISASKPAGQWNKVKIKKLDGHLQFWFNGKQVVDTQMWNEHWKEMVNNSKFKDMEGFSAYKKGHIALQDHGGRMWYRNIKIKRL